MKKNNSEQTARMPLLFLAHGNPMNAIAHNDFTRKLSNLGRALPTPKYILCISAHWLTQGTWVTHMAEPKTIHDFYGFPEELFDVLYPAKGSAELAELVQQQIDEPQIGVDDNLWGFDHGTWSVLKHLYPEAQIPVVQLSLDISKPPQFHFDLGKKLARLRNLGVLIVGSGNIVHNLSAVSWDDTAQPHKWAIEFDEWVKKELLVRNFAALTRDYLKSEAGKLSVPTPDHYYPLLYILGAVTNDDALHFDYEGFQNASISMRCLRFA